LQQNTNTKGKNDSQQNFTIYYSKMLAWK